MLRYENRRGAKVTGDADLEGVEPRTIYRSWPPSLAYIPPGFLPGPLLQVVAPQALPRRRQEGLTRHEALHAIGAVLARHIGHVLPPGGEAGDARGRYEADLEGLSADSWRQRFAGDEED